VLHFNDLAHGVGDFLEQLHEPLGFDVEWLAALDAFEFDRAELVAVASSSPPRRLAGEGALHGLDSATPDEFAVGGIRGGPTTVVTALLTSVFFAPIISRTAWRTTRRH